MSTRPIAVAGATGGPVGTWRPAGEGSTGSGVAVTSADSGTRADRRAHQAKEPARSAKVATPPITQKDTDRRVGAPTWRTERPQAPQKRAPAGSEDPQWMHIADSGVPHRWQYAAPAEFVAAHCGQIILCAPPTIGRRFMISPVI